MDGRDNVAYESMNCNGNEKAPTSGAFFFFTKIVGLLEWELVPGAQDGDWNEDEFNGLGWLNSHVHEQLVSINGLWWIVALVATYREVEQSTKAL